MLKSEACQAKLLGIVEENDVTVALQCAIEVTMVHIEKTSIG